MDMGQVPPESPALFFWGSPKEAEKGKKTPQKKQTKTKQKRGPLLFRSQMEGPMVLNRGRCGAEASIPRLPSLPLRYGHPAMKPLGMRGARAVKLGFRASAVLVHAYIYIYMYIYGTSTYYIYMQYIIIYIYIYIYIQYVKLGDPPPKKKPQ